MQLCLHEGWFIQETSKDFSDTGEFERPVEKLEKHCDPNVAFEILASYVSSTWLDSSHERRHAQCSWLDHAAQSNGTRVCPTSEVRETRAPSGSSHLADGLSLPACTEDKNEQ